MLKQGSDVVRRRGNEMDQNDKEGFAFRKDIPSWEVPQNDLISFRKQFSTYRKMADSEATPTVCPICGEPISGICNSHTIPQYCLREIAKDGKLYTAAVPIGGNLFESEVGLKEAATFKQICKKCDCEFFKLYETPEVLYEAPDSRVLGQIAAKNLLRELSKGKREIELQAAFEGATSSFFDAFINVREMDVAEDERAFKKAVRVGGSKASSAAYSVVLYKVLPYVVPVAFQQMVSPISDFRGEMINNAYNPNPKYRLEPLHVGIFPSKGKTVVLAFRDERAKRYRQFERQLNNLSDEQQLHAILKLVIAYSEDVMFSKHIPETVIRDEGLAALARMNHNYFGFGDSTIDCKNTVIAQALEDFAIDNLPDPPNLLLEDFSITRK